MKVENIFDVIKFDDRGLIPAIAQDFETKEILMMAFMNEESLRLTIKTKIAHYFSRSRNGLWKKGETSGQTQSVKEVLLDCDSDCIIIKIEQLGKPVGVACHTGRKSCFYKTVDDEGNLSINQKVLVSNEDLYGKK